MSEKILSIKGLAAKVEDKQVLRNINLEINTGEVHVIMGPNGSGKSTLANVLMGHPAYEATAGEVIFRGEDLFSMSVDERARAGMFLSFQYPEEIAGITNEYFIRKACLQKTKAKMPALTFRSELKRKIKELDLDDSYLERYLNLGFSGGEKKNEILQMSMLKPLLSILDETDSGLDVDAIRVVYETIQTQVNEDNAVLLITHYSRIMKYIKPDFIHLLVDGEIVKSGDASLALAIDQDGYEAFRK